MSVAYNVWQDALRSLTLGTSQRGYSEVLISYTEQGTKLREMFIRA